MTGLPDDGVIARGAKQSGNHAEKLLFFASGRTALAQLTMKASAIALAEYELLELILFRPIPRREVMQRAINQSTLTILLVHSHPSDDPTSLRGDIEMTKQIVEVGKQLKIAAHDHVVVGRGKTVSFQQLGLT